MHRRGLGVVMAGLAGGGNSRQIPFIDTMANEVY